MRDGGWHVLSQFSFQLNKGKHLDFVNFYFSSSSLPSPFEI
jgi:hypothetical protein